jgi:hypothetical protein
MTERAGRIVYRIAIVLALGWFLLSMRIAAPSAEWGLGLGIGLVGGLVVWVIGGAIRHLMTGK